MCVYYIHTYIYNYDSFALLYGRNQHNIVKKLFSDLKEKKHCSFFSILDRSLFLVYFLKNTILLKLF